MYLEASATSSLISKGTGDAVYNSNVASQNQWAASAKNSTTNSAKSKAQSSSASASGKLKSAANSWAANKSTNPVTGGSMGKDKTVTATAPSSFTETKRESPQDLVSVGMKASDTFWVSNKRSVFLVEQ